MSEHVVAEVIGVEVADDLGQADLVVDYEESLFKHQTKFVLSMGDATHGILLVESIPRLSWKRNCQQESGLDTSRNVHADGYLSGCEVECLFCILLKSSRSGNGPRFILGARPHFNSTYTFFNNHDQVLAHPRAA